jgi:hypothetical protein
MHPTQRAYLDEMEKLSASVDTLVAGLKRLRITKSPTMSMGPAYLIPEAKRLRGARSLMGELKNAGITDGVPDPAELKTLLHDDAMQTSPVMHHGRPSSGIYWPSHGGLSELLARVKKSGGLPASVHIPTGAGARAANAITGIHESHESKVPARYASDFYHHLSPMVVLREHNAITTLTGKGAADAKKTFQSLREGKEAPALKEMLRKYDPNFEYGSSARLPRSVVKRVGRDYRAATPDRIRANAAESERQVREFEEKLKKQQAEWAAEEGS